MKDSVIPALPTRRTGQSPPAAQPPPVTAGDCPLDQQHMEELARANERAKKVMKAAKMAAFNCWGVAIFAGLSLLFSLSSLKGLLVGVGMAVVAWNEFRGGRMVRRFDLRGPVLLGWNQVGFAVLLVAYSSWSIWDTLATPNPYLAEMQANPAAASTLGSIGELYTTLTVAVYGGLIVLSIIFQGLTAVYYFTRSRHMRAYLEQTPDWVVRIQRATSGS